MDSCFSGSTDGRSVFKGVVGSVSNGFGDLKRQELTIDGSKRLNL